MSKNVNNDVSMNPPTNNPTNNVFRSEPPKDRMIPKAIQIFIFIIFLSQKATVHPSSTKVQAANDVIEDWPKEQSSFFFFSTVLQRQ